MPVLVQNAQAGPTVFTDGKDIKLEWQGKGHPGGEDVQYVPDEVLKDIQFVRNVRNGIFVIVEDATTVTDALDKQSQTYSERLTKDAADARASIDPAVNNDLVSLPCIGPAERGIGECKVEVAVREKQADEAPILCDRHRSLASQYLQVETGESKVQGDALVPVKKWVRVTTDPRTQQ